MSLFTQEEEDAKELRDTVVRRALRELDRAVLTLQAEDEPDDDDPYAYGRELKQEIDTIEDRMKEERMKAIEEMSRARRAREEDGER